MCLQEGFGHIVIFHTCSILFPYNNPFSIPQVTQHPSCHVQLLVLPESSSGEHKVKLVQVVAKVPVGGGGD